MATLQRALYQLQQQAFQQNPNQYLQSLAQQVEQQAADALLQDPMEKSSATPVGAASCASTSSAAGSYGVGAPISSHKVVIFIIFVAL